MQFWLNPWKRLKSRPMEPVWTDEDERALDQFSGSFIYNPESTQLACEVWMLVDPGARLEAVRELDDPYALWKLGKGDSDPSVRHAALKRLLTLNHAICVEWDGDLQADVPRAWDEFRRAQYAARQRQRQHAGNGALVIGSFGVLNYTLPEFGGSVVASVLRILIKEGDTIAKGQPVLELQTDQLAIKMPAPIAGVITKIRIKAGDEIKIGQVILSLEAPRKPRRGSSFTPPSQSKERHSPFPCNHKPGWFDYPDFAVICPECFGHFFKHAFIPYLIFLGLFSAAYFWRALELSQMLFIILLLFVTSYISAVLRRRLERLMLSLVVLVGVTCLVFARASTVGNITSEPLDFLSFWSLVLLGFVLTISFGSAAWRVAQGGIHNASPLLALAIVASVAVTICNIAANAASALAPALDSYRSFTAIRSTLNWIQYYRLLVVLLALCVAFIWAGALSVTAARERDRQEGQSRDGWWLGLVVRLLEFFAGVLAQIVHEVWKIFRDTLRHLWTVAAGCARVFGLIIASYVTAVSLQGLGLTVVDIWENNSFWLHDWRILLSIAGFVILSWFASWAVILIAIAPDERKVGEKVNWSSELGKLFFIWCELIYSTPIYWFYRN